MSRKECNEGYGSTEINNTIMCCMHASLWYLSKLTVSWREFEFLNVHWNAHWQSQSSRICKRIFPFIANKLSFFFVLIGIFIACNAGTTVLVRAPQPFLTDRLTVGEQEKKGRSIGAATCHLCLFLYFLQHRFNCARDVLWPFHCWIRGDFFCRRQCKQVCYCSNCIIVKLKSKSSENIRVKCKFFFVFV